MTVSEYASERSAGDREVSESTKPDDVMPRRHRRRWTTIVLESHGEGWRATQTGVDVEGHGATAADAAAAYCRQIAETGERERDDDPESVCETAGGRDG